MAPPDPQINRPSLVETLRERQRKRQVTQGEPVPIPLKCPSNYNFKTEPMPPNDSKDTATTWINWGSHKNSNPPKQESTAVLNKVACLPSYQKSHPPTQKTILKNDHLENFILTSSRPQNYVRDSDPATRFIEYPKLETLFTLKRNLVNQSATPPRYLKIDLWKYDLRALGSQFDVILIDPPLEEYASRSSEVFNPPHAGFPSSLKTLWSWEDIASMNIQDIAAPRSFIFIWTGDGEGLERGRDLLARWGYRRAEDIVWAKTNKTWTGSYQVGPFPCLQRQKEHCLVGIRGTLKRSTDTHFIHCNVDTDVIISEEPHNGDTAKPEELYTIIENFCLGKRRLELFGRDNNIRKGWLTVGAGLSGSNYNKEEYVQWFRNAAVVPYSQEVETLRPKSPPPRNKTF
ncbi:UNVERIFIED_CONTAM: N6-adenosine-methyltransferase subunit mettl14 [Siphonaria sp. JEL0065]|nr:N6-adenosine-methyltransferase subunit mettl14 [Siphonaria sp. JEL0065]